jgi:release factor glutamine methyltransferase
VRWLIESAAGSPAEELVGAELDDQVATKAFELAHRRAAGEPLQYITGIAGFRHLELAVGPGVLIPRPETEMVVERALAHLPQGGIAVDVGTGSGAIALSIKFERPDATVLATEISAEALEWAELNRAALDLDVQLIECDLLAGLPTSLRDKLDLVVANPPYVPESDARLLARDVVDHEPSVALFAGPDGTDVIRTLAQEATGWLRSGGWFVTEIAANQAGAVADVLTSIGYLDARSGTDLAGRERVAEARRA